MQSTTAATDSAGAVPSVSILFCVHRSRHVRRFTYCCEILRDETLRPAGDGVASVPAVTVCRPNVRAARTEPAAGALQSVTVDAPGYACVPGAPLGSVGFGCKHDQIERPAARESTGNQMAHIARAEPIRRGARSGVTPSDTSRRQLAASIARRGVSMSFGRPRRNRFPGVLGHHSRGPSFVVRRRDA